ncbi:MAG: hypothetical protein WKG07_11340 [Hymenobacter sp.]
MLRRFTRPGYRGVRRGRAFEVGAVAAQFRVSVLGWLQVAAAARARRARRAALPHRGGPCPAAGRAAARAALAASAWPGSPMRRWTNCAANWPPKAPRPRAARRSWQALQALDLRRKKSVHAAERDTERVKGLRRAFLEALPGEDVRRFKFVDETSVNLTYTRRYGRAAGGRRVDQAVPLRNGPNVTVVAAPHAAGPGGGRWNWTGP